MGNLDSHVICGNLRHLRINGFCFCYSLLLSAGFCSRSLEKQEGAEVAEAICRQRLNRGGGGDWGEGSGFRGGVEPVFDGLADG